MYTNYIKVAIRSLLKHKAFSLINLLGLAIGMASCLIISLYLNFELSYDRFHEKADRTYRIAWRSANPQTRTPHPMTYSMVRDFPEVESAVSLSPVWGAGMTRPAFQVRYEDKLFEESGILSVDSTFFQVFSFSALSGNLATALDAPNSVVITKRMAQKYFGEEEALGKVLRFSERADFLVTAVVEDVPEAAHFHFDFLLPYSYFKAGETGEYYEWADFGHYNYIVLAEGTDHKVLEDKMMSWANAYIDWPEDAIEDLAAGRMAFELQPLVDIHLYSHLRWELEGNGHVSYIYLMAAAALVILLIACVNFMNLTTARSLERAKEVGLRKTLGARRGQLVGQFLGESLLLTFVSLVLAIGLVELFIPYMEMLTGHFFYLSLWDWAPILLMVTVSVALLAGAYPAFVLSAFRPVNVLRGRFSSSGKGKVFRRLLVVFQFSISSVLIIGTLIIFQQLNHLRNQPLGFDQDQLLSIQLTGDLARQYPTLKQELAADPDVISVGALSNMPGEFFNQNPVQWRDETVSLSELSVDEGFIQTMGLELVAGRGFSKDFGSDSLEAFMLNEAAVRMYGWEDPIGQQVLWLDDEAERRGTIIGVIKDFNYQSLHSGIGPMIIQMEARALNYSLLRLKGENVKASLERIEKTWKKFGESYAFNYSFVDESFGQLYRSEERMGQFMALFTALAIFIACLGLYGLATFTAQLRTREIGIRKVLGASPFQIVTLLSGDFLKWVLGAFFLAIPIAWWVMTGWLEEFAYHIEIGPAVFMIAGALALLIAGLATGFRALSAAMSNPVDALRSE